MDLLAPTYHYREGPVGQLPFRMKEKDAIEGLGKICISTSKSDWDSFETSWDFQRHPLVTPAIDQHYMRLADCWRDWEHACNERFAQLKANEEELNRIFIDIYGLQDELTPEVDDKDVTVRKADLGRDIRSLISYAVGCMLGRYSLDKPGLAFAGGNWQEWLAQQDSMTYAPDKDGILPITDDEYFYDDIVTIFVEWVKTVYGAATLEENLTFADALQGSVKGFVHSLAVDFSAYDPNNFAKSLRIYAKEGEEIRGFEEFGTGEQQILLMAFVKAYMQTFGSENIILLIEEPEAHLHPLAQKWLKEYIVEMCKNGIQIVISTHSPDFVDPSYLSGLVRVYKEGGITHAVQISKQVLRDFCVASGVPENRITVDSIDDFYSTKLNSDHLKGLFAETVLLVEGATEYFALPCFMKQAGFSLSEHGIEIVACGGKETIPLLWRLFKAYKYNCYFIFDSDSKQDENTKTFNGIIDCDTWISDPQSYVLTNRYAYFGKDFEHYFRSAMPEYNELENEASESYGITSKPGKARSVAQHCSVIPSFITELVR